MDSSPPPRLPRSGSSNRGARCEGAHSKAIVLGEGVPFSRALSSGRAEAQREKPHSKCHQEGSLAADRRGAREPPSIKRPAFASLLERREAPGPASESPSFTAIRLAREKSAAPLSQGVGRRLASQLPSEQGKEENFHPGRMKRSRGRRRRAAAFKPRMRLIGRTVGWVRRGFPPLTFLVWRGGERQIKSEHAQELKTFSSPGRPPPPPRTPEL